MKIMPRPCVSQSIDRVFPFPEGSVRALHHTNGARWRIISLDIQSGNNGGMLQLDKTNGAVTVRNMYTKGIFTCIRDEITELWIQPPLFKIFLRCVNT